MIEHVVIELERLLSQNSRTMTEALTWDAINNVLRDQKVQNRVELLTPMRHALTGRRVSGLSLP
jgi:hypothetical protein